MFPFFGRLRLGFQQEKLRVAGEVRSHRPRSCPLCGGLAEPVEPEYHEVTMSAYLEAIKRKYRLLTTDKDLLHLE